MFSAVIVGVHVYCVLCRGAFSGVGVHGLSGVGVCFQVFVWVFKCLDVCFYFLGVEMCFQL